MKIAIVGDFEITENYPNTKHFIAALKNDGRFQVIACTDQSKNSRRLFDSSVGFFSGLNTLTKIFANGLHFTRMMGKFQVSACDVIYVPYPAVWVLFIHSLFGRKSAKTPLIVMDCFISIYETVVDDRKIIGHRNPLAWVLKKIEKAAVNRADVVIADTIPNADYLYDLFGGQRDKYRVVNLCINEMLFSPKAAVPKQRLVVLFVGSFVPLQGVDVVARAAIELRNRHDIQFHIVGDGQTATCVESILAGWDLNLVWDRGWYPIDRLAKLYSQADICLGIFGSTAKANRVLAYKMYMGMASAKPVISIANAVEFDASQNPPFLAIENNSVSALVDRILVLADSPELRLKSGQAGRSYYVSKLSNASALDSFFSHMQENLGEA